MGLDMYLNAKRFLWHDEKELSEQIAGVFPDLKGKQVKEVIVEAMYWRKSNAIHKWFVDNVQKGVDDCGYYYVSRDQLEALHQLILEVLDTKDATKLSPVAGFFFGSTAVDEWYWEDLRSTADKLEELKTQFQQGWEFEYHSSW
jgi:hypothetical protein